MKEGENKKTPRMHRFAGIITATPLILNQVVECLRRSISCSAAAISLSSRGTSAGSSGCFFAPTSRSFSFVIFTCKISILFFAFLSIDQSLTVMRALRYSLSYKNLTGSIRPKKIVTLFQLILMERLAQSRLQCLAWRHQRHRLREVHLHQMLVFHPV